jgi:hypothetical protein
LSFYCQGFLTPKPVELLPARTVLSSAGIAKTGGQCDGNGGTGGNGGDGTGGIGVNLLNIILQHTQYSDALMATAALMAAAATNGSIH